MSWHHDDGPVCRYCEYQLKQAHPILQAWFHEKKQRYLNLHISCSYRGEAEQNACYRDGKSKAIFPNSAHNKTPSQALDLFLIDEDGQPSWPPLLYAKLNAENEAARAPILWGGKFKTLVDGPHFELIMAKVPALASA